MSFGEVNSMLEGAKAYNRAALALSAQYAHQQEMALLAQSHAYAQAHQQAHVQQQAQYTQQSLSALINAYAPPPKSKLESWWDRLQRRGEELGDDDMPYAEWSQWMTELDEFREAAHG